MSLSLRGFCHMPLRLPRARPGLTCLHGRFRLSRPRPSRVVFRALTPMMNWSRPGYSHVPLRLALCPAHLWPGLPGPLSIVLLAPCLAFRGCTMLLHLGKAWFAIASFFLSRHYSW